MDFANVNKAKEQSLSLVSILTRNLLLFSIMMFALLIGTVLYFLDVHALNLGFLQLQAERLSFIFLIIFSCCYISLLFILIERSWLNFFVQSGLAIVLFFLLLFIFNPLVKLEIVFSDRTIALGTRSWDQVHILPIRTNIAYFTWLQLPDQDNGIFPNGVVCLVQRMSYIGNFVVTTHYQLPYDTYMEQQGKLGMQCNNKAFSLIGQTVNLEKALMNENYELFIRLDSIMQNEAWYDKPLVVTVDQLPTKLREKLANYAQTTGRKRDELLIKPSIIKTILEN